MAEELSEERGSLCGRAESSQEGAQGKAVLQEHGKTFIGHWELRSHLWGRECSRNGGREWEEGAETSVQRAETQPSRCLGSHRAEELSLHASSKASPACQLLLFLLPWHRHGWEFFCPAALEMLCGCAAPR